eukprot:752321-Prymnesium_polylepis.1
MCVRRTARKERVGRYTRRVQLYTPIYYNERSHLVSFRIFNQIVWARAYSRRASSASARGSPAWASRRCFSHMLNLLAWLRRTWPLVQFGPCSG